MFKLYRLIEQHWQQPKPFLKVLLFPLSRLFANIVQYRRRQFLTGKTISEPLPVPVVVVGNIHVGGTGKTPITSALVLALQTQGVKVGIISRGYGRKNQAVHVLNAESTAQEAGDEPLLLYQQTGVPVAVAAKRIEAGKALLAAFPEINLLIADDGLQHYALARDIEIAVFPYSDVGRHDLDVLPNGALREPIERLMNVDAVVISGCKGDLPIVDLPSTAPLFRSYIENGVIYQLNHPENKLDSTMLEGKSIVALAGIAKPERFFNSLRALGISLQQTYSLPDHAPLTPADLPQADVILITEKDAVKLLGQEGLEQVWVLSVCAIIEPDLATWLINKLYRHTKEETL